MAGSVTYSKRQALNPEHVGSYAVKAPEIPDFRGGMSFTEAQHLAEEVATDGCDVEVIEYV